MKNVIKTALFSAALLFAVQGMANPVKRDTTITHKIGNDAKKVGHKTSNIAANAAARVGDKRYDEKYGPHGETVYIDKHDRFFYISKRGHRVYITKSQLTDKKED